MDDPSTDQTAQGPAADTETSATSGGAFASRLEKLGLKAPSADVLIVALAVGLAVMAAICRTCICNSNSSGKNGERDEGMRTAGGTRGTRKHSGREKVPVLEDLEDADFVVIHLQLQDGREASLEMLQEEIGSFKDLREQLAEEIQAEFETPVELESLQIRHETQEGVWKTLTAHKWARVRRSITHMRAVATAKGGGGTI